MKYRTFMLSILCASLFFGCDSKDKPIQGDQKISLKTINNEVITLQKTADGFKDGSGKTLLLNFFTTSCVPCDAELPHLNNLQSKYKDELKIISVLLESKTADEIKEFTDERNIGFIITNDENNFRLSTTLGNITNVPHIAIYDKEGKYATHYIGAVPEEMIEADLKRIF